MEKKASTKKKCKTCLVVKPMERFRFYYKKNIRMATCKDCHNLLVEKWRQKQNPESIKERKRNTWRKKRYGISSKEYDQIYLQQEGKCIICHKFYKSLDIDHCHEKLIIRGLLCGKCNRGLGFFNDSILLLENAINYLKTTNTDKSKPI